MPHSHFISAASVAKLSPGRYDGFLRRRAFTDAHRYHLRTGFCIISLVKARALLIARPLMNRRCSVVVWGSQRSALNYEDPEDGNRDGHDCHGRLDCTPDDELALVV